MSRPAYRPALVLGLIAVASAILLAGLDQLTRDRIVLEQDRRAVAALIEVLPDQVFDNELAADWIELELAGLPEPARVYRARLGEEPVASIIDLTTPRGYSGDIRLLVAVAPNGTLIAVRVLDHRETPGLGDQIEIRRSRWIEQFRGLSLGDPPAERWAPDRRGGDFDSISNATLTAAAVIEAVRIGLEGLEAQGQAIWTPYNNGHDGE